MKEIMDLVSGTSHNFRRVHISETESQQMKDPFISICAFTQATLSTYAQILFSWTVSILMRWSLSQVRMVLDILPTEWDKTSKMFIPNKKESLL